MKKWRFILKNKPPFFSDPAGIQTLDLQNRNLWLFISKSLIISYSCLVYQ